jgi:hypothetical protein
MGKWLKIAAGAVLGFAVLASSATASTGSPCLTGGCSWVAVVMAQPNLPPYSCAHQEWADSDPNTQQVWISPQFHANAPYSATVTEAPLEARS